MDNNIKREPLLTHFDKTGNAIMVDVGNKEETKRVAVAKGRIMTSKEIIQAIRGNTLAKGDVLGVARVAGIMATKETSRLIPMCHPLMITSASVDFVVQEDSVEVTCTVATQGKTGVEMEALTGATVALLTIYDMCKALDKSMVIQQVYLAEKSGGKSGHYRSLVGMTGTVLAVNISEKKGTQKKNIHSVNIVEGFGLEGDAHGGNWHRQVSLLSYDKIKAFNEKGANVQDGDFGENLVVEGIDFKNLPVGTRLKSNQVILEMTQIGKECHQGCQIFQKMGDCIMPREGVFAKVIQGGVISQGDKMEVLPLAEL